MSNVNCIIYKYKHKYLKKQENGGFINENAHTIRTEKKK
jgi:hypothetical protein